MLSDMAAGLGDIYPFLYETLKGGLADKNPVVQEVALSGLLSLFGSCDIEYSDYCSEIRKVFDEHLLQNELASSADVALFQLTFKSMVTLESGAFVEQMMHKLFYKIVASLASLDDEQIYLQMSRYADAFVDGEEA